MIETQKKYIFCISLCSALGFLITIIKNGFDLNSIIQKNDFKILGKCITQTTFLIISFLILAIDIINTIGCHYKNFKISFFKLFLILFCSSIFNILIALIDFFKF